MTIDKVLERARAALKLGVRYKLGAGGRDPLAATPADGGLCDCSGFTAWALGFSRVSTDPFYTRHAPDRMAGKLVGWVNTDSMVADAKDPGGFFDLVPVTQARPADLMVFGKGNGRSYGHVGIVSAVRDGAPVTVIHCSAANAPSAIAETTPDVFFRHGAILARYRDLRDDDGPLILSPRPAVGGTYALRGKASTFGGPGDSPATGNARDDWRSEGLALRDQRDVGHPLYGAVFLPLQPYGTTGAARRLNPDAFYLACRWDYARTPREFLRGITVPVQNARTGKVLEAIPVDWGPNEKTGRVTDLSPGLARALGLATDDEVLVTIPLPAQHNDPL